MAAIMERRRKDGSLAFFAQIRVHRHGRVAHTESKTFDRRSDAEDWGRRREAEIAAMGEDLRSLKTKGRRLADAIDTYTQESLKEIGKTKAQVLRSIKSYDIAALPCAQVDSPEIVAFAKELASEGRAPSTVLNYISHLSAVFAIADPAWGFPLDEAQMQSAAKVCARLGLTAKSAKRDRRPTLEEMNQLMEHFERRSSARRGVAPMARISAFALFSSRRLDEITRALWSDLDQEESRLLVRDMKHPGDKIGNDVWSALPEPALRILNAAPRLEERIFPYGNEGVSAAFTRACRALGIEDLHFHDLRHEGVSRLAEMGLSIPQIAQVSGHRSWTSLQRYAHVRQSGDKWANWPWLERLAEIRPEPADAAEAPRRVVYRGKKRGRPDARPAPPSGYPPSKRRGARSLPS